jgi:hypothetical protein
VVAVAQDEKAVPTHVGTAFFSRYRGQEFAI